MSRPLLAWLTQEKLPAIEGQARATGPQKGLQAAIELSSLSTQRLCSTCTEGSQWVRPLVSWDQVKGVSGSHEAAQILFPALGTQNVRVGVNVCASVVLALASSDNCRVLNARTMPCALLCLSVRQQSPSPVSLAQGLLGLHQAGPRDHSPVTVPWSWGTCVQGHSCV